jgi:AmmeMemoRadiSam system protein A
MTFTLNDLQRQILLQIARSAVAYTLKTKHRLIPEIPADDLLKQDFAVFVTLKQAEKLRGCVGQMQASEPLYLAVNNMAYAAAFNDHRFLPVTEGDLASITIEISILTPLQRIDDYRKIRLGTDGVLIRKGWKSGVFLPQVAEETGWDLDTFLQYLCAHKASLPTDAYKQPDIDISVFQVYKISEM